MHYRNHPLRDAIVLTLIVSSGSLVTSEKAHAQSATDLDTVTVTGTRIKSQTMTASSPVTEISAEEFAETGATSVEELVNQYPQLTLSNDNFENNGSTGYSTVSLRDLGASRTLTLVNGRRLPPGTTGEVTDTSIVAPAALKQVDVLTGGASAVYGADAVAGVVNFVLDDEFQGVKANIGYSTYQHDNDNGYIHSVLDEAGYPYPNGNDSSGGTTKNIDLVVGGDIGERGHILSWLTWRENDALLQGERDYSACALDSSGTVCAGSGTTPNPNFTIVTPDNDVLRTHQTADGKWQPGFGQLYNFAPINYYQRPDTRITAGTHIEYEFNEHFQPYLEAMFLNRQSTSQIAESGTFFTDPIDIRCDDSFVGGLCNDLGITDEQVTAFVGKRNVEGGPRITDRTTSTYRFVAGAQGAISDYWTYDASFLFGRNSAVTQGRNDLLKDRIVSAILQCPPGSFDGCVPYDVWTPNGVTPEAAAALTELSRTEVTTYLKSFNGFVSGDLGFGLPSADGDTIKLVAGYEWRETTYKRFSDVNSVNGNFAGSGGPTTNRTGSVSVSEVFLEASVPLLTDVGALSHLGAELGYRNSDYSTSGRVNTFKVGLGADFAEGKYRLRTGWNRAIRAPTINDLFAPQQIALWRGSDPCAGDDPTASIEECANTGVTAEQYGNISESPANQYNQFVGGNPDLNPEEAETWTIGFAATPINNLNLSIDYYDITVDDAITSIGAPTILNACLATGSADLCPLIQRNERTGDLWLGSDPSSSGTIKNLDGNFGTFTATGIDLIANYRFPLGAGNMTASFNGNYVLEQKNKPVPGDSSADYDCAGVINDGCQLPEWRHIANIGYNIGRYNFGLRWRYVGELDYRNQDGSTGEIDQLLVRNGNKVDAYNYLDLSATVQFGSNINWTLGVNNIADKEPPLVGGSVSDNGNSLDGYDQAGRFIFTNVSFRF